MTTRRTIRRVLLLFVACGLCAPVFADTVRDEDVKLALIYKISRFVTWPDASAATDTPFRLCLAEQSIFDIAKDRFAGRQIRDRDIEVRLLSDTGDDVAGQCDVLYMARVKQERVREYLEQTSGQPVLTISDDPDFAESGGMIGLSTRGKKIIISINVGAYESSDLTVSSQLLELAELIDDERIAQR